MIKHTLQITLLLMTTFIVNKPSTAQEANYTLCVASNLGASTRARLPKRLKFENLEIGSEVNAFLVPYKTLLAPTRGTYEVKSEKYIPSKGIMVKKLKLLKLNEGVGKEFYPENLTIHISDYDPNYPIHNLTSFIQDDTYEFECSLINEI